MILNDTSGDDVDALLLSGDVESNLTGPTYYLTSNDFKKGETTYLFDGEYKYESFNCNLNNVSIIGQNREKTIIEFDNLTVTNTDLILKNLTIVAANFKNLGNFMAENVIFKNGNGQMLGEFPHSYGGSICTAYTTKYVPHTISLNNCSFIGNNAEYGGAIYVDNGFLEVYDCLFLDNYALQYGGAIAVEKASRVTVKQSRFVGDRSLYDAGGAIYIIDSALDAYGLNISNCSATFGGAITALNSNVNLNSCIFDENHAEFDGGAVFQMYGRNVISGNHFFNNTAVNGGGLFLDSVPSTISNNNFSYNHALNNAGAFYCLSNSNIDMTNNCFAMNSARFYNDTYSTSVISSMIRDLNSTQFTVACENISSLPSYYNLADYGYVSPVKDQEDSGNCWAYSIIAALESSILKASNRTYDLSEGNVKNLMAKYSSYGWNKNVNRGGNDDMAIGYLVGWLGPVLESQDPTSGKDVLSALLGNLLHVQNVMFIKRNDYLDNDGIKEAILRYGGVVTGMLYSSDYLMGSSYYYTGSTYTDHSVVIVGWDDKYSRNNFAITPPGDGAFIVKNSWGDEWADEGYFYVSYYDRKFAEIGKDDVTYVFPLNDSIKYEKNYQYDIAGKTDYLFTGKKTAWYQNIFTATDDEYLAAVSTYFADLTNWECQVYVNDVLKVTKSGISNVGYYTFPLGDLISLKSGDVFRVVFRISSKWVVEVPVCKAEYVNKLTYHKGVSFISNNGNTWHDLYDYESSSYGEGIEPQVACIKAFTISSKLNSKLQLEIAEKGANSIKINAKPYDEYGNLLNTGKVIFRIENQTRTVDVVRGAGLLEYTFEEMGEHDIIATFIADNYNSSNSSLKAVIDAKLDFDIENITYGDKIVILPVLTDSKGFKLTDKISVTISNRSYVIDNSKFTVPDIFDAQTYNVTLSILNMNVTKSIEVFKSGSMISYDISTLEDMVKIKALINNRAANVIVKFKGTDYESDDYGCVSIQGLGNGNYTAQICYLGDENHLENNTCVNFTIRITPKNPELEMEVNDIFIGENLTVKISINKNATKRVIVELNNVNYTADDSGILTVSGLAKGQYHISCRYEGDEYYYKTSIERTVNVCEYSPKIIDSSKTVSYGDGSKYSIIVYGFDGKIASNALVCFRIGKTTVNTRTDSEGIAAFKITQLPGTYKVSAAALGASSTKTLKVSQILVLKKVNVKKSAKRLVLTAKLKKVNGKYLKNRKITFKFNAKKYTGKTNAKGVAKIIIKKNVLKKLKKGKKLTYTATFIKNTVKKTVKVK